MVKAVRIDASTEALLDPGAPAWRSPPEETLALTPTPISVQPSVYVIAKWKDLGYGAVQQVRIRAAHNGEALLFRLTWDDETASDRIGDTDQFADAAAVLFPLNGDAPIANMGMEGQPVNAWYWRPDLERPLNVTAQGPGTTVRHKEDVFLEANGRHADGGWSVVVARPFGVQGANAVSLAPGQPAKVGFAVWQGANQERGGLKAFTPAWQPLEIEA
ncbi:MAG TPA: ethylbenzene dehydrogenase-related protein [Dehalococcoidia bacterium]|nr:ethylbenzene dehydrogenase-related protein [Dehalococcoidia bacterium]